MCVSRRGDDGDGSPVDDGQSVTSNLDGLKDFRGDASANSIMEADGNKNNGWELW